MTRFTGTSFKITPISITGNNIASEELSSIANLLNEKIFGLGNVPDSGWLSFQSANNKESITREKIQILKFPDDSEALPATGVREVLDASLKKKLPPSVYLGLSDKSKYSLRSLDFLFYKDKKLFCLISSTGSSNVASAISLLESYPIGNKGFTINKYPSEFSIPADLILWLLYVNYEKNRIISSNLKINDIVRLDGVLKVPNSLQYSGASTPENLIELKLSIAQKRTFTGVELILNLPNAIFQFSMNTDGCVELNSSHCELLEDEARVVRNLAKIIHIYKVIIPKLKEYYFLDTEWHSHVRDEFIIKCSSDCKKI